MHPTFDLQKEKHRQHPFCKTTAMWSEATRGSGQPPSLQPVSEPSPPTVCQDKVGSSPSPDVKRPNFSQIDLFWLKKTSLFWFSWVTQTGPLPPLGGSSLLPSSQTPSLFPAGGWTRSFPGFLEQYPGSNTQRYTRMRICILPRRIGWFSSEVKNIFHNEERWECHLFFCWRLYAPMSKAV